MGAVNSSLTLCLDTSDGVAVALLRQGRPVAARRSSHHRRHVETLTPLILDCLQEASATAAQVAQVAVGTGPAPFTGLRVGLVTARTFAQARGIDVLGVSSLEAIAAGAGQDGAEVLVATDARRREIYWGRYRSTPEGVATIAGPAVASAAAVAAEHEDLITSGAVLGRAVALYPEELAPGADEATIRAAAAHVVDPAELGLLALTRAQAGQEQPPRALYLRLPDVQTPQGRKRAS